MGCGPGPGRQVTLEQYQQENPDDITVIGDIYTFVADHTIPAGVEIIFGANDTLIIGVRVDVTLEGKLNVIDETDNFIRILVNGTFIMVDCSEIEFGDIINGGIGINVNNLVGTFTQNGGDIIITNVNSSSAGIFVGFVFTATAGTIQIDTVTDGSFGIAVRNDGVFTQAGTNITITNVTNSGTGISVFTTGPGLTATYNQNAGNITFGQLTTNATAIEISSDTTFTKANGPTISITNAATGGGTSGMVVTGTAPFPSVVINLGPNNSIDMNNSDTHYTPALTVADPLAPPWDGAGSLRAFYAP
jgi:hypothetical protein